MSFSNTPEINYKLVIAAEMEHIKADPVFNKLIIDNYKNARFGYTQTVAVNAIKELKEAGTMPMDQYGVGIWGQGDWVVANYPKDEYGSTGSPTAPVIVETSMNPPVIVETNPNPGATPTNTGNPANNDVIPPTTVIIPEPVPPVTAPITAPVERIEAGMFENPLVKLVLVLVAVLFLVKIISK